MPMLQKQKDLKGADRSSDPAEKLLEVIERDMAKYSPTDQTRKWDALKKYVKDAGLGTRAKR